MEEINLKGKTILAIGAHPDNNDFGFVATTANEDWWCRTHIFYLTGVAKVLNHDKGLTF